MPDDKTPEEILAQFTVEVAALRDQSARSTDPLLVAKAIAAGDLGMQEVVLSKLSAGERGSNLHSAGPVPIQPRCR